MNAYRIRADMAPGTVRPARRLRIGFLWHVPFPWDVRLDRMMRVCLAQGHAVSLLCKGKPGMARSETRAGVRIRRVSVDPSSATGRLGRMFSYPLFCNPVWIGEAQRFFAEEQVDLVIVRDLPLAMLAARVGRRLRRPTVIDMAENYPAALKAYRNPLYAPFLLGDAWLPRRYEQASLKRLDHAFVVAAEQTDRLVATGVDPRRITLVGNTPEPSFYRTAQAGADAAEAPDGSRGRQPASLLFVGMLDAHRGVDLAIAAMPGLLARFPDAKLVLAGTGKSRAQLIAQAAALGVQRAVEFPGWLDHAKVPETIRASSICLIPHLRSEHTDTTLPNKLFDYMAFGKPVVASDCVPIRRVIEETGCGITFRSGDAADLERVLVTLLDSAGRDDMGRRGMRAVAEKYNWEVDERNFLATLDRLASRQEAR